MLLVYFEGISYSHYVQMLVTHILCMPRTNFSIKKLFWCNVVVSFWGSVTILKHFKVSYCDILRWFVDLIVVDLIVRRSVTSNWPFRDYSLWVRVTQFDYVLMMVIFWFDSFLIKWFLNLTNSWQWSRTVFVYRCGLLLHIRVIYKCTKVFVRMHMCVYTCVHMYTCAYV